MTSDEAHERQLVFLGIIVTALTFMQLPWPISLAWALFAVAAWWGHRDRDADWRQVFARGPVDDDDWWLRPSQTG